MARQTSVFQLEGTLGELCFYKTRDGYFVRKKGSISKSRMKTDPAFARVRANGAEFATAAHAVKLFRAALAPLLRSADYPGVTGRLMRTMMQVIKADEVNEHGERTFKDGDPVLLEGFEFNQNVALTNAIRANFTASIDRAKGTMTVDIPAFSPATQITAPEGATHFRLFSGGVAIDFEQDKYNLATAESAYLPISRKKVGPIALSQMVKKGSSGCMFLVLGIEFVHSFNGIHTLSRNGGTAAAMRVVRVYGE